MTAVAVLEVVVGALIVFFVPGYAATRALFPEWRIRGRDALRRSVETLTLSLVLRVVLTVLIGYLLLVAAPGGFQAAWNDPVLEAVLLGVAVVAFVVAALRGAFAHPPPTSADRGTPPGEEGAWELTRELDQLGREERRLRRTLATSEPSSREEQDLRSRLVQVEGRSAELRRRREGEYAEL